MNGIETIQAGLNSPAAASSGLAPARPAHWTTRELVTIGIFATVIKASAIMVAYMGGGMNPVTLAAKNCLYVTLMIVLLHKVPRPWTMTLAVAMTALVSLLLMGQGALHAPGAIVGAVIGEGLILALGGYGKTRNLVAGIITAELLAKAFSLGVSWLAMREQPAMLIPATIFVIIGAVGTILGAFVGVRFMKELRHAGIISD